MPKLEIYKARKIITMNPGHPEATHVGVRDGLVVAVGSESDALQWGNTRIDDRWTILILRDLFLEGPQRYRGLATRLSGIGPDILSDRLKTLEKNGIVERHLYEQQPPRAEYPLTKKGSELGPVLGALRKWGDRHTAPAGA